MNIQEHRIKKVMYIYGMETMTIMDYNYIYVVCSLFYFIFYLQFEGGIVEAGNEVWS